MTTLYNFKNVAELKDLLSLVFDLSAGHDHDGVNSKEVTTGTPSAGSVGVTELGDDALAASAAGRAKMEDGFFTAATILAKFPADSFTPAVLLQLIQNGAFAADTATRALFANGLFTAAKLAPTARTQTFNYIIEDLGAGADITDRVLMFANATQDLTLINASIVPMGASAGVDDGNTAVITLKDGAGNTIVAKTYDTAGQPPAASAIGDLGALDETYKSLSAGEKLTLSIAQGATANLPGLMLQVTYSVTEAA